MSISTTCLLLQGLLSMANTGPDTNTSHFSIMMGPAPHLDGKYTIFGEVVEGFEVGCQFEAISSSNRQLVAIVCLESHM